MAQCDAERKLLRILHYGSEEGCYVPGCRLQKKFYTEEKVNQLRTLISEIEQTALFDIIRKVIREKTLIYPEIVLYVLAECAKSDTKRPEALSVAEEMCTTAEYFLLFFKFAKGLSPHIGTGRACRRFITNWYLKKDSLELAEMVGQTPSYRGWKHADLIRIAHIKSPDPAVGAVLTYLSKGVKVMTQKYENEPKALEVVSYLKNVDNFRKDGDKTSVIRTIENYLLTVHHLNFIHLRNQQVWIALLRRMPVDTLLEYFHLLCKYKLFRDGRHWDQDFLTAVCDVLSNVNSVRESKLQPSRVYIELCRYKAAPKYKLELAAKNHKRLAQKPPAISYELIQNLQSLIIATYKNVEPTGLRYVIAVDSVDMSKRRCRYIQYISASGAAAAIATTFFVAEEQCDIILLGQTSAAPVDCKSKEADIQHLVDVFSVEKTWSVPKRPFRHPFPLAVNWAVEEKKEVDVFILIGTSINSRGVVSKMAELKSKLLIPDFKLVLCCLCGTNKQHIIEDSNVLTVVGFDKNVCTVISRFAKGVF